MINKNLKIVFKEKVRSCVGNTVTRGSVSSVYELNSPEKGAPKDNAPVDLFSIVRHILITKIQ